MYEKSCKASFVAASPDVRYRLDDQETSLKLDSIESASPPDVRYRLDDHGTIPKLDSIESASPPDVRYRLDDHGTIPKLDSIRKRPQYITFVAPIVTYVLVLASGTAHVIYALLPVIAEVSRNGKIRPERPLSISVIAGFQGVIASPISAATVAMLGFVLAQGISLPRLLAITIPSTFLGVVIGSLSVAWRGKSCGRRSGIPAAACDR